MTIETTHSNNIYLADGTQYIFTFDFKVAAKADVFVFYNYNDTPVDAADYTITLDPSYIGGTITFKLIPNKTPVAGTIIDIARILPITQTTQYPVSGPFPATSHERALDKLTMIVQGQERKLTEGLSYSPVAGTWESGKLYRRNQFVYRPNGGVYLAAVDHTSGVSFDDDFTLGKWTEFINVSDSYSAQQAALSAAEALVYRNQSEDIYNNISTEGTTQINLVIDTGDEQYARLVAAGDTEVADLQIEGQTQTTLVQNQGTTTINEVIMEGDDQVARVIAEGDTQVARVETEADTQVLRVTDEGDIQVARVAAEFPLYDNDDDGKTLVVVADLSPSGTAYLEWTDAGTGVVQTITATSPLSVDDTIPTDVEISIPAASSLTAGYMTTTYANKLDNIEENANLYVHPTGLTATNPHNTTKTDVGLDAVDNTSDENKPISTLTQSALDLKADIFSPELDGTPTLTNTPPVSANDSRIANTAYVRSLGYVDDPGITDIDNGGGISVSIDTGVATITNTNPGSSQYIFKNVAVSGQDSIVADSNDATLTIAAGANVTLTTDDSTDTLTIGVSGVSVTETDPVFTAWDKSTGISITESQISDLGTYLTSYTETDPVFTAWDKSTGISITKSQVSDFGTYQEPLVSGTNIKTINSTSILGSGDITISGGGQGVPPSGSAGQILAKIDATDYNTEWIDAPTGGGGGVSYEIGDVLSTYKTLDSTWLELDGTMYSPSGYPDLATTMGTKAGYSYDMDDWDEHAVSNGVYWNGVCWSPDLELFCAVGWGGTNRCMTSPDGINWTQRSVSAMEWKSVCWSPELGLFAAVGSSVIMTSPDGITWTDRTTPQFNQWQSVCWSPELGIFCAVGGNGTTRAMYSSDGITWTSSGTTPGQVWWSVCWSPELGIFCAISNTSGGAWFMTSPDGITWTGNAWHNATTSPRICWSPELGLFCIISGGNANTTPWRIHISNSGLSWLGVASQFPAALIDVCWSPEAGLFCVATNNGPIYSKDGINWVAGNRTLSWTNTFGMCYSPDLLMFCSVKLAGTHQVNTSTISSLGTVIDLPTITTTPTYIKALED